MHSHSKLAPILPPIIDEAEKYRIAGRGLLDTENRRLLLLDPRHGSPVGAASAWPTGFQVVARQARANGLQFLKLHGDEIASGIRRHTGVKERVDVGSHEVQYGAEVGGMFLEDADGLRGGDGA